MKTILIVDDDRVMTTMLSMWLKRMGYAVLVEHDVPEALKVMKIRLVDAIILDLDMPSGHGTEVVERLKVYQRTGSIPIIVLSANEDPKVASALRQRGADHFLVKPTDAEEIATILWELISKREEAARKEARELEAGRLRQTRTRTDPATPRGIETLLPVMVRHRLARKGAR